MAEWVGTGCGTLATGQWVFTFPLVLVLIRPTWREFGATFSHLYTHTHGIRNHILHSQATEGHITYIYSYKETDHTTVIAQG